MAADVDERDEGTEPEARIVWDVADAEGNAGSQDEGATDDDAVAKDAARGALGAARGMATGAATTLKGGLSAMRDVRAAARQHADAQRSVRALAQALEQDRAELAHRKEVEANYEGIVSDQTSTAEDAEKTMARAQARVETLTQEVADLGDRLSKMRASHEQEIRPYRRVMETSRGRAADASQTVAEARRAVKAAEGQLREATDARTQGIAQANRNLDNSQERLRRVQDDLRRAQGAGGKADATSQLQRESVAELAHVEAARAEVAKVTRSAQEGVEKAQMHLWTQRQSLETAQADADAAKRDYEGHKAEHDEIAAKAARQEKELEEAISSRDAAIEAAKAEHDRAADAYDGAQALLAEARAIHASPEITAGLAESISTQEAELEEARGRLEELAASEKTLRRHTRSERYVLVAVTAVIVVLLVALAIALTR